jgi:hypothetical protein
MNPPTTLMVAKITAKSARIVVKVEYWVPADIKAPTIVIPEIALEPDIKGVCSVGGTFVIISKPTNIASTKIVKTKTNISIRYPS